MRRGKDRILRRYRIQFREARFATDLWRALRNENYIRPESQRPISRDWDYFVRHYRYSRGTCIVLESRRSWRRSRRLLRPRCALVSGSAAILVAREQIPWQSREKHPAIPLHLFASEASITRVYAIELSRRLELQSESFFGPTPPRLTLYKTRLQLSINVVFSQQQSLIVCKETLFLQLFSLTLTRLETPVHISRPLWVFVLVRPGEIKFRLLTILSPDPYIV